MITNFIFYASLVAILSLATIVYIRGTKSLNEKLFFFVGLSFSIWMTCNFFVDFTSNLTLSLLLARSDFAFAGVFAYLFLIFCLTFPVAKSISNKKLFL